MNMLAAPTPTAPPAVSGGFIRLVVDFESFYARDYSLAKMTPLEYITDRRFELIGASLRTDDHPIGAGSDALSRPFTRKAKWVDAYTLPGIIARIPWERVIMVSHNIAFDGALLAWRFGKVPALYMDTLGMSRALVYPYTGSASLEKVAEYLGLPPKQKDVIVNALGWRRSDFEESERQGKPYYPAYRAYCEHDSDLCAGILDRLAPQMPPDEIVMMDMVARMAILPQFSLNRDVLTTHLKNVQDTKAKLLERLEEQGILKGDLMSDQRLAGILKNLGVDPPTKISARTQQEQFAFAKTDKEFTALQEHEDPIVQALVAARLGVKTTIEETRTERFIACAEVEWPADARSAFPAPALAMGARPMCFPLKYSGAHTHRLSGDWKLNLQNLGRTSKLRLALEAPPGFEVVSADASQIEARVVCWLAGALRVLSDFRNKNDPYLRLAERIYGVAVGSMNKKDHAGERFVGKTGVLGLGFGMGRDKFIVTCWNQGRVVLDPAIASRSVQAYRQDYAPEVPELWKRGERLIDAMIADRREAVGPIHTVGKRLFLPNGMWLHYNNLRRELRPAPWGRGEMTQQALFEYGRETKYLFGGKIVENMVQALARIITMSAALRIRRKYRNHYALALQVHDQLGYVLPIGTGRSFLDEVLIPEMRTPLEWCPDLPLDAEGAVGPNLLEAK